MKILVFQLSDREILEKIRLAALLQGAQVQVVEQTQYHRTIGALASETGPLDPGSAAGAALPEPMLVLCMPQSRLDGMLAALRGAGVPPMAKAVLTPVNAGWKPAQLLGELRREREAFEKARKK